jgi:hypothetical protein
MLMKGKRRKAEKFFALLALPNETVYIWWW